MADLGYVTLPVIASFQGIDAQVNKTFGLAGKKASKDFGKSFGDGLKSTERDVKAAGDAYTKLRNKAEDSLGKIRIAEAALTKARSSGDTARTVAAEERLNKARRDSGISVREATTAHNALKSAQDSLKGSSGSLVGGIDLSSASMVKMGAIAGGAAATGLLALGAGAIKVGKELYDLGSQFDDLSDNIRIKTGATGAALDGLVKSAENISKTVPLGLGDIGDIAAQTNRALHITGPALEAVAGNIANLGRLTGEKVNIQELGKAFRSFGVDAKDQVPALNSLLQANQKTGLSVNAMLTSVVKGGAVLREFGFDLGESAGLVGTFEAAGLDGDKALTSMTKGLAAFAKAGQDPKKALQDTTTEIQRLIDAGDDPAALNLTNKVFGAKGGVNFFDAIKSGNLDLQALSNSVSGTGDTIAQAAADTDDWAEKWQIFKNKAAVALEPIATGVFNEVNADLDNFATWVDQHQPELIGFFATLGEVAITAAENVAHGAGGMLQAIGDLAGGIGNVKGVLDNTMAFFADLRGDHAGAEAFRKSAQEAFGWGESIRDIGDKLANLDLDGARDKVKGWGDAAKTAAENAQGAGGAVTGLGTALGALPMRKPIVVDVELAKANADMKAFFDSWKAMLVSPPAPTVTPVIPSLTDPNRPRLGGGRAAGGSIFGPGTGTSDSVPIMASHGEHMWTAGEVNAVGGQANMYRLRALARKGAFRGFSGGGPLDFWKLADPRGSDPHGGPNGEPSLGPFAPWWDMDWMPPEHPERVGDTPGGRWWHRGPTGIPGGGGGGGRWRFPPIGKNRPRAPGEEAPPDSRIKQWSFAGGGAIGSGVTPEVSQIQQIATGFGLNLTSGRRNEPGSYHNLGEAGDFSNGTRTDQELAFALYMAQNYGSSLAELIYDDPRFSMTIKDGKVVGPFGAFYTMGQAGDHTDHVHIALKPGSLAGYPPPGTQSLSGAFPGSVSGTPGTFGTSGGTSGLGPSGEAGTFDVDQKQVREAEQRVAEADARVREEEAAMRELKADAKESERIRAENQLAKSKQDAQDARADLAEAQKGKFTAGKAGGKGGGGQGQLGELGSIAGSFLKETFGIDGSWLPDIANLAPVQAAGTLLGSIMPMVSAYQDGSWTPGGLLGQAMGTSSAPFGIPDASVPPPGTAASGMGAGPAPGPVNVDQSINYHGPVGWDPAEIDARNRRAQNQRVQSRIPG